MSFPHFTAPVLLLTFVSSIPIIKHVIINNQCFNNSAPFLARSIGQVGLKPAVGIAIARSSVVDKAEQDPESKQENDRGFSETQPVRKAVVDGLRDRGAVTTQPSKVIWKTSVLVSQQLNQLDCSLVIISQESIIPAQTGKTQSLQYSKQVLYIYVYIERAEEKQVVLISKFSLTISPAPEE